MVRKYIQKALIWNSNIFLFYSRIQSPLHISSKVTIFLKIYPSAYILTYIIFTCLFFTKGSLYSCIKTSRFTSFYLTAKLHSYNFYKHFPTNGHLTYSSSLYALHTCWLLFWNMNVPVSPLICQHRIPSNSLNSCQYDGLKYYLLFTLIYMCLIMRLSF